MPLISITTSDQTFEEAQQVAAELGISVEDIAATALDAYLDQARTTRGSDLDDAVDRAEPVTNVAQLDGIGAGGTVELEGTESWLSTETDQELDRP